MSTTETLRTRLDALQTQLHELQIANRKLREQNPQGQQLLELEEELRQSREENVRLAQEISQLNESGRGLTEGSHGPEVGDEQPGWSQLQEANAQLESQAERLRRDLRELTSELSQAREELEQATQRAEEAEENAYHQQCQELRQAKMEAELERLRAVAAETKKWEEWEARLVRRIEELERGSPQGSPRSQAAEMSGSQDVCKSQSQSQSQVPTAACASQSEVLMPATETAGELTAVCGDQLEVPMTQSPGREAIGAGDQTRRYVGTSGRYGGAAGLESGVGVLSVPERNLGLGTPRGGLPYHSFDVAAPEFRPPQGRGSSGTSADPGCDPSQPHIDGPACSATTLPAELQW